MVIKNVDNITQSSHYSSTTYLCVYLTLKFENINMIFKKIIYQVRIILLCSVLLISTQ